MVGYTRAKTMQKPAVTKLLHRPLTWAESSNQVREVLSIVEKRQIDILYYEEDGKYRNYSLTRPSLFFGSFRYSFSRTATTSMLTFLAAFSSTTRARWVRPSSCETETLDVGLSNDVISFSFGSLLLFILRSDHWSRQLLLFQSFVERMRVFLKCGACASKLSDLRR